MFLVRSKSLHANKILTGFRPIMRLRGVKKNTWREQRKPQTFVNVADGRSTLLLSELLASLLQIGFSSALVKVIPGDFSMQSEYPTHLEVHIFIGTVVCW
jgi:hypothetical protein